ncbi:hypothetical protein MNBD_GAMMA22-3027 [hydrothermal vent metagenome]|uniref:RND efflux pump membrane fusion protein barrel-sandwich domain-containing protein n=1 Tax=hydrothermal vent metagenome TaxID=652676 RepID=A0A3B0ZC66_9ZZZZ
MIVEARKLRPLLAVVMVMLTSNQYPLMAAEHGNFNSGVFTVAKTQDNSGIVLSGKVVAFKEITFTAQRAGRIEYIAGDEGSWFPIGRVVLAQNDEALVAQRNAALAQIRNKRTGIQNSRMQYQREMFNPYGGRQQPMAGMAFPAMFDRFFTPGTNSGLERQADIYSRYSGVSQAQASYQQALSQLRSIDEKLRDSLVITPFEGVITKKMVEVGDSVQAGQALFTFSHTRYFRVQAQVPVRLVSLLHTGMLVDAYLDNMQYPVRVRVAKIYPAADDKNHTVTVKFDMPTGVPAASGMYVQLRLPSRHPSQNLLLAIPQSALIKGSSLPGVMLLLDNNKTELRVLRLGHELPNGQIAVLAGLKMGERIIANPSVNRTTPVTTAWTEQ